MKKIFYLSVVFANLALAQELVPNPSFENWINANPPYPTTWNCANCTKGTPNTGTYSAQLNLPSTSASTSFNSNSNVLNIVAGKTYTVSYYYKTSSTDIKSSIINVYKSNGSRFFFGNESSLIKDGQWHKYTGTFTADISSLGKIDIAATITFGFSGSISYDDISVIESSLSTDETNKNFSKPIVYPNPATDKINVENSNKKIKNVTVYNIDGKKILESEKTQINVNSLSTGNYIIKIKYVDDTSGSVNFIKK